MKLLRISAVALTLSLFAFGCDDPSKGKPTATVGSAKPVAAKKDGAKVAAGAKLTIDATASKVEFVGSKAVGKHEGGFKKVSGSATLAGGKPEGGSVEATIDMKSVYSDADKLTKHLMGDDFFDIANHATAKFVSTEIKKGGKGASHTVTGNLTLRGKTNSITFPATITTTATGASVKAEFSINRKDFGMVYNGKADNLIRDGVVIKLTLALKKG